MCVQTKVESLLVILEVLRLSMVCGGFRKVYKKVCNVDMRVYRSTVEFWWLLGVLVQICTGFHRFQVTFLGHRRLQRISGLSTYSSVHVQVYIHACIALAEFTLLSFFHPTAF